MFINIALTYRYTHMYMYIKVKPKVDFANERMFPGNICAAQTPALTLAQRDDSCTNLCPARRPLH